jgi:hypothetical protein
MGLTSRGDIEPVAGPLTSPYAAASGIWAIRQVGTERLYGHGIESFADVGEWLAYITRLREAPGAEDDGGDEAE